MLVFFIAGGTINPLLIKSFAMHEFCGYPSFICLRLGFQASKSISLNISFSFDFMRQQLSCVCVVLCVHVPEVHVAYCICNFNRYNFMILFLNLYKDPPSENL